MWKGEENASRFNRLNRDLVCRSKEHGGLGIKYLDQLNQALLAKWAWKYLFMHLVSHGGSKSNALPIQERKIGLRIRKCGGLSPVWKDISLPSSAFWNCISFNMGNGENICFWEDVWLGYQPLCSMFEGLYEMVVERMFQLVHGGTIEA